jgi:hypothetical protein
MSGVYQLYKKLLRDSSLWKSYIRMEEDGSIEYADSSCVFGEFNSIRYFRFVVLIGLVGQFVHFVKRVLSNVQYDKGGQLLFNLVGTRETILADFSHEQGADDKCWRDPFARDEWGLSRSESLFDLKCQDPNIQLTYRLVLADVVENTIKEIMNDVASRCGLGYNHQTKPRCYNYNTDIFLWKQFAASRTNNCS